MKRNCNGKRPGLVVALWAIVLIGFTGMVVPCAHAAEVQLAWDKPETDMEFAGYKIYYVEDTPDFDKADVVIVNDPHQTTEWISGLEEGGVYYFAASTYQVDENGKVYESERSGTITHLVPGEYKGDRGSGIDYPMGDAGGGGGGGCFINATSVPL